MPVARQNKRPNKRQSEDGREGEPSAKQARFVFVSNFGDIIEGLVGREQESISVSKDVICEGSKFFDTDFADTKEKLMPLPEVDPEIYRVDVHWLYTSKLRWGRPMPILVDDQNTLIEAYLLADFLDDAGFRTAILANSVKTVTLWKDTPFSDSQILQIWEATPKDSALRTFTFHWMVCMWKKSDVVGIIKREMVPREFFEQSTLMALECVNIGTTQECEDMLCERLHLKVRE